MFDLSFGDVVQGGAGMIAAYLAIQIKRIVDNHEVRITKLEGRKPRATPRNRKRTTGRRR